MNPNADKLAAIVTQWVKPVVSQITAQRIGQIPVLHNLESTVKQAGLVSNAYKIESELIPFIGPITDNLLEPTLRSYFSKIPDDAIPALAKGIVDTAKTQPKFSILDGLIEFDPEDLNELSDLLEKNLPVTA